MGNQQSQMGGGGPPGQGGNKEDKDKKVRYIRQCLAEQNLTISI